MSDVTFCPKGHTVGTRFGRYKCVPNKCGEVKNDEYGTPASAKTPDGKAIDLNLLKTAEASPDKAADLAYDQKRRLAGMPQNLQLEDALKYAQDTMLGMLPEAVANLKWDMRYGSEKQRTAAVERVLAANGLSKREAQQQTGQTIIVNMGVPGANSSGAAWLDKFVAAKVIQPAPHHLATGSEPEESDGD